MIDLRSAQYRPSGASSFALEVARASEPVRFFWMRCCERCLSRTTYTLNGAIYCSGCDRPALDGQRPSSGGEGMA